MLAIAIPAILLTVRSRPPGAVKRIVAQAGELLETSVALRRRSFWLITFIQFAYFFCTSGCGFHLIAYMIDIHYNPRTASWVLSACFLLSSMGKIVGLVADRTSGRVGMTVNFTGAAISAVLGLYLTNALVLIPFIVSFGLTLGAPLMLVPVMIAESLGMKRFGSLSGLIALASMAGAVLGPIVAGRIHDLSGSYTNAYDLFLVVNVLGGLASVSCLPYKTEQRRMATRSE